MILEHGKVKRAGIYLFYNENGIADDSTIHMIQELKKYLDFVLVVCNGFVDTDSLNEMKKASDELICRANVGYDLGAYRDGLLYLGYRELKKYDEILAVNVTFSDPYVELERALGTMEPRDLDFWGIIKHSKGDPPSYPEICPEDSAEYVRTEFLAVRKSLLMSYEYRDFMINRPNPNCREELFFSYESVFTEHFSSLSYKWETFSETTEYKKHASK